MTDRPAYDGRDGLPTEGLPISEARLDRIDFRTAWQRNDRGIERDAMEFWKRLDALPGRVDPQQRASELCLAAYVGDQLIGVSTAVIRDLPTLRNRFAFFRCLVDPRRRGVIVAGGLMENSFLVLARWSLQNPDDRVMGMATIHEGPQVRRPVMRAKSGNLTLVGYTTAGAQIRVAWFDHAIVD